MMQLRCRGRLGPGACISRMLRLHLDANLSDSDRPQIQVPSAAFNFYSQKKITVDAKMLNDRVALITRAGRGIGRAIALGFAKEGASIAGVARTDIELTSLEQEIGRLGGRCVPIVADLADPAAPAKVVDKVVEAFGTIDILVNNAGAGSSLNPRPLIDFDNDFWNYSLALNLSAPYLLCKAVVPILMKKGSGRIVNIASIVSKIGFVDGVAYAGSKPGLPG